MGSRYHRSVQVFRKGEGPLSLQPSLLPSSLDDFLPSDHQVRRLRRLVEEHLSVRLRSMALDCGGIPHDPVGLFSVWVYGMMQGERSSRRLEDHCRYDVRYAHLCAGVRPDHATLARFRDRLGDVLPDLFSEICELGKKQGMLPARVLAVDGTKVAGASSQWRNALKESAEQDEPTMVDARNRFLTGYNVQVGVDTHSGFIAGCHVSSAANDSAQMSPVLEAVEAQAHLVPEAVVADTGYDAPANHVALGKSGVVGYIVPHPHRGRILRRDESGVLRCPAGHEPSKLLTRKRGTDYDVYRVSHCRKCPLKLKCGVNGHQKEVCVQKGMDPCFAVAHAEKMSTEDARAILRLRGPTVERTFAELKATMRFDRFRLKGQAKARLEVLLLASAYNLRMLLRLIWRYLELHFGPRARIPDRQHA